MSEHDEQVALFNWARLMSESRHPQLAMMFSIPNGGKRKSGWWEKAEGLKAGVPDIFLAVPVSHWGNGYQTQKHGLFIEMKFGKNKPTAGQKGWLSTLEMEGYDTVVCNSFEEAKQAIIDYLLLEEE